MATCCVCQNHFLITDENASHHICLECTDMGYDELDDNPMGEPEPGDVDEIQENEDFARDNDYGDGREDQYLDNSWEDAHERDFDYGGEY